MAIVGSQNLNRRSLVWDTENAIIVTDPAAVAEVQAMIDADMATDGVFEPAPDWPGLYPAGDPIALAALQSLLWAF
jgi:phosphatidylserine/phosphatidylglycerophosphate/cardiolipin synthase-like enzyme